MLSKFKQLETRVVKLEVSFPKDIVAAYNLSKCPDGCNDFSDGHVRMILGLGAGKQLKPIMKLLSAGGAEAVKLTNRTVPRHHHSNAIAANKRNTWGILYGG